MSKARSILLLAAAAALVTLAGARTALATCYTCTLTEPHVCVPAAQGHHGWTDCTDGPAPDEPCDVNFSTGCTGTGVPMPMITSRSLVFGIDRSTRDRLLAGGSDRILKGRGRVFDKVAVLGLLTDLAGATPELDYRGAAFSVGDADVNDPVLAAQGMGYRLLARSAGASRVRIEVAGEPRELRLEHGDLALVAVDLPSGPGLLAIASDELATPAAGRTADLVALQLRFRDQVAAWNSDLQLSVFGGQ